MMDSLQFMDNIQFVVAFSEELSLQFHSTVLLLQFSHYLNIKSGNYLFLLSFAYFAFTPSCRLLESAVCNIL